MSMCPPPAAHSPSIRSMCDGGWMRSSCSRVAAGDCTRVQPNQSSRSSAASSPMIRAGRSGWFGTSCASEAGWWSQIGAATPIPYGQMGPDADLVVVGAGAAGLFTALTAAADGARVALVSALPLAQTASYWAQGGLAAALAVEDSPAQHLEDTLAAGRGLVRRSAAETLCAEAPARFNDLVELGVRFDADQHGKVELGLEGGHSVRRVVHAGGSATGRRILRTLAALVVADPRITVREG